MISTRVPEHHRAVAHACEEFEKAADHHEKATRHFREAARKAELGLEIETDHHARFGAAHAARAAEHARVAETHRGLIR